MTDLSPFADSVYAQHGLTHQIRQFDQQPLTGQSYLAALATPSAQAVNAEAAALADAVATGVSSPSTTRASMTSHNDAYVNFFDSTTIDRNYSG